VRECGRKKASVLAASLCLWQWVSGVFARLWEGTPWHRLDLEDAEGGSIGGRRLFFGVLVEDDSLSPDYLDLVLGLLLLPGGVRTAKV